MCQRRPPGNRVINSLHLCEYLRLHGASHAPVTTGFDPQLSTHEVHNLLNYANRELFSQQTDLELQWYSNHPALRSIFLTRNVNELQKQSKGHIILFLAVELSVAPFKKKTQLSLKDKKSS